MTCFLSGIVQARPELGPPSIELRTNLSNVVIAELESISPGHKLTFIVVENLHNEADETIVIRSDALTTPRLEIGRQYVVAYVKWDVQTHPRVVKLRRDGAVIINLPGAMPGIFQPDADLIEMITWDLDSSLESPDAMLATILRGMADSDPQLQNFFSTELVTRQRLYSQLTRKQRRIVSGHIGNPGYSAAARTLMLGHTEFSETLLRPGDKLAIAREIVTSQPVHVDFGSEYGGLIRTAMRIIEEKPKPGDALKARRWLRSNQPALVESAAAIIFAANPDGLIGALEEATQYTLLEQQSRETLTYLLRRYNRIVADN